MATFTVSGELGSAADWAAFVVSVGSLVIAVAAAAIALLGAIAVAYLGWQANRQVDHIDATERRVRQREADLLMILFEGEFGFLKVAIGTVIVFMENAGRNYGNSLAVRKQTANIVGTLATPEVDSNFARIHVLPDDVCYSIARLKGILSMLRTTVDAGSNATDDEASGIESSVLSTLRSLLREAEKLQTAAKTRRKELVTSDN